MDLAARVSSALILTTGLLGIASGCSSGNHAGTSGAGAGGGTGTGGGGPDPRFGTVGYGAGDIAQAPCTGVVNPMGPGIEVPWPSPSNTGHDGPEGSSLHFTWSGGMHNVVQVASWQDYWHPSPSYADPGFVRGFESGPEAAS